MSLNIQGVYPVAPAAKIYLSPIVGDAGAEDEAKDITGFCHKTPLAKALSTYALLTASLSPTGSERLVILLLFKLTLVLKTGVALTTKVSAEASPITALPVLVQSLTLRRSKPETFSGPARVVVAKNNVPPCA